jgi:DNA topoisomerase-3
MPATHPAACSPPQAIVREHCQDHRWGQHATRILEGGIWRWPRAGGHNDKAHPPIHPTRYSSGEQGWTEPKKRLYDFIVRHFLA